MTWSGEVGGPVHLARLDARQIVRDGFPRALVALADAPLWGRGGCPHDLYNATGDECVRCRLCYHRKVLRIDPGRRDEVQECQWCGEEKYPFRERDVDDPYRYDGF